MNKGNAPGENCSVVKTTVTKLEVVAFICIPSAHRWWWESRRITEAWGSVRHDIRRVMKCCVKKGGSGDETQNYLLTSIPATRHLYTHTCMHTHHTYTHTHTHALTLYIYIVHCIHLLHRDNDNQGRLLSSSSLFLKMVTKAITFSASCSRFHLKSNKQ